MWMGSKQDRASPAHLGFNHMPKPGFPTTSFWLSQLLSCLQFDIPLKNSCLKVYWKVQASLKSRWVSFDAVTDGGRNTIPRGVWKSGILQREVRKGYADQEAEAGFKILALGGTDIVSFGTGLTLQSGTISFKSAGSTWLILNYRHPWFLCQETLSPVCCGKARWPCHCANQWIVGPREHAEDSGFG